MATAEFVDDRDARRYRLLVEGEEVGFVDYDPVGSESILIKHTEVGSQHAGRGYGSELVRRVIEDARARGLSVIPICPYALNYIRRHPEHRDAVRAEMRGNL
jgi:predicted GNAT family acetyltransferase